MWIFICLKFNVYPEFGEGSGEFYYVRLILTSKSEHLFESSGIYKENIKGSTW